MDTTPSNENDTSGCPFAAQAINSITQRHSELGVASTFVGGAMVLVQLGVLAAVFSGIKDNQGVIYAVAIPFVMYCIGVPLGLLAAFLGFVQPRRNRKYVMVGVASTIVGPLLFAIFVAVQVTFHPW